MECFVELTLGNHMVSHGYDSDNKEVLEEVGSSFAKKLVAVSRIKSLSEKYILLDYLDGRWVYWEYKESYEDIKELLQNS